MLQTGNRAERIKRELHVRGSNAPPPHPACLTLCVWVRLLVFVHCNKVLSSPIMFSSSSLQTLASSVCECYDNVMQIIALSTATAYLQDCCATAGWVSWFVFDLKNASKKKSLYSREKKNGGLSPPGITPSCSAPKTPDVCVHALGEPRASAFKYFFPVCPAAVASQAVTAGPLFSLWVDLSALITSDLCQKYIPFPDLSDCSTHSHRVWCVWIWPLIPARCIFSLWVVSIESAGVTSGEI